jgi:hypothetical protein
MYRSFVYGALLASLAVSGAACDRKSTTTPTTPGPVEIIEPDWTGTLTVNGAQIKQFNATDVGTVTALVTALDPSYNATLSVGLDIGTWSGTSCRVVISNVNVGIGSGVIGFANGAGALCARISDVGNLIEPVAFTVQIKHY